MNIFRYPVTLATIAACAAVFIYLQTRRTAPQDDPLVSRFSLIPVQVKRGQYWRMLTVGFIHLRLYHFLVNMYALYNLGSALEPWLGSGWFALILFGSVIGGSFACVRFGDSRTVSVGISGGLYGLLAAYIILLARLGMLANRAVLSSVLRIVIVNAIISMMPNISLLGHAGGAVTGAVLSMIILFLIF